MKGINHWVLLAEATQLRRANKELEENLQRTEQRFSQLQKTLLSFEEGTNSIHLHWMIFSLNLDKKGVDTRLQGAQNSLLLQEENIRRTERERKTMLDQIAGLERQLLAMENEKKQLTVRIVHYSSL